jgi:hypothetical protein
MLIYTQMPGAHFVCTARKWRKDYRREIKINARPIVILQPMGPILFVFDVSDTAPLPNARPLPPQVDDPFQVRNGKIGGQLALTIDNARRATTCGSPNVPMVRSGPDPSNGPQPGSIWNETQPGGEVAALGEHIARTNRRYHRAGDDRPDTGDADQPLAAGVLARDGFDLIR